MSDTQTATTSVVAIEVAPDGVRGLTVGGEPRRVIGFAERDLDPGMDTSLAVAEVYRALTADYAVAELAKAPVAVVAQIDVGIVGPGDGVSGAAKDKAVELDGPVRWTTWNEQGLIVDAHEVDRILQMFDGAGIAVSRIDLAEAAALSVLTSRGPMIRRQVQGCSIPKELISSHPNITHTTLAPAIGSALAALRGEDAGDLSPHIAQTALPAGGTLRYWAIEARTAPVDFAQVEVNGRNNLQLAAAGLTLVVMALLIVLLITS